MSHGNLVANISSILEYLELNESDCIVNVLPFYYSYGNSLLHTHIAEGGCLILENSLVYAYKECVDAFAVALVEESVELREAGIEREILILNGAYAGTHREIIEHGLTLVVSDASDLAIYHRLSRERPVAIHLKVDTGMSRLGVPLYQLPRFLEEFELSSRVRMSGLMTHLARADDDPETTAEQLERFEQARQLIKAKGYQPEPSPHITSKTSLNTACSETILSNACSS
ncbi:MAG: alanine racemase, partial [Deltaproteobacteria bacterium]|nr:alanine racemase [Deltaproteobacteria bacterium]